jgi:hypothetical protein
VNEGLSNFCCELDVFYYNLIYIWLKSNYILMVNKTLKKRVFGGQSRFDDVEFVEDVAKQIVEDVVQHGYERVSIESEGFCTDSCRTLVLGGLSRRDYKNFEFGTEDVEKVYRIEDYVKD